MANLLIYENASGGWTLVDVPEDGPDGHFYMVPHVPDLHFKTKDEGRAALLALNTLPLDDWT